MKVASNVGAAQDAVSEFAELDTSGGGQQVTLSESNVSSMQDGSSVANRLLDCISELASGVKGQASNVTALAAEIQDRDKQDASGWCEAR
ncbi:MULTISPECIES: hypothetical protein [unclassified Leifsonia]|uniref:hypothetical protein n=1 Tax=unclassified Leifsonia TaxID=2663824 RepID=UPI00037EEFC5|nr:MULTISPECIES: hypothetical protein [unclassified Leifsonia]TDP98786.1 hypothetical protein AXZ95_2691 [Leifsonia sp. 115AMFTsu3.1]